MTKGRTGEQSAHCQAEEELFRLERGGGGSGAGRRWVEGRWRLGGMLWQRAPLYTRGTPGTGLVRNSTRAGGLRAVGSLFGEKILATKGASCPGPNPTARRLLGDLPLALEDRQHPQCMDKHPAAACTGLVPGHAQPRPCPPATRWQPDTGLSVAAISADLRAVLLPGRGQSHACGWAAPHCAGPAAGGRQALALQKFASVPTRYFFDPT